jgi:23S rRNA pseudouridine2605 synthase
MERIRLQKVIARAGVASRRAAEEMIRQGRVQVNGRVVTEMGLRVEPGRDEVRVDGKAVGDGKSRLHLLVNKPRNCVTTTRDPQGRKTVLDLVGKQGTRIFPVGRLDFDAEGLLLLTNDGELAHRLQHPSYGVRKEYEVKVRGVPREETLERLRSGIELEEGTTAPAEVERIRRVEGGAWLRIVLHQGWNRQIKRMGEAVGHPVLKIRRVGYGPLRLRDLPAGRYRRLTPREADSLYRAVGLGDRRRSSHAEKKA